MQIAEISSAVRAALERRKTNKHRAALDAELPPNTIRNFLKGHKPRLDSLVKICSALDLELYVGPPRDEESPKAQPQPPAVEESPPWDLLISEWTSLRRRLDDQQHLPTLALQNMPGMRAIGVVRLRASAGHGSPDTGATPEGVVWFPEKWLEQREIDPVVCTVMRVYGDSMEPTLPDGSSILVDRTRRELEDGRIFVCRPEMGLIVKRAKLDRGRWLLISDNPVWPPIEPHPQTTEIYGEVRWTSRTFW